MRKIVVIILACIMCIYLTGCDGYGGERVEHNEYMNEWISPDGVHYWMHEGANGLSYMAPRYNHDGNLVIDN